MCDMRPTATLSIARSPDVFTWHISESLDGGARSIAGITALSSPVTAIDSVRRRNFPMSNLVVIDAVLQ
ncbi:hypothetical protein P3T24_000927 [Paraburkholderia sp. GAS33]|jgi:hypothetical protein